MHSSLPSQEGSKTDFKKPLQSLCSQLIWYESIKVMHYVLSEELNRKSGKLSYL